VAGSKFEPAMFIRFVSKEKARGHVLGLTRQGWLARSLFRTSDLVEFVELLELLDHADPADRVGPGATGAGSSRIGASSTADVSKLKVSSAENGSLEPVD
jgi:hypothetical protein